MSAQVTEAHRELVGRLQDMILKGYYGSAQEAIADSEARACDQLRAEVATCNDALEGLVGSLRVEVERWELAFQEQYARAASAEREAERLKRDYDYDHKCLHEVRERCELWKQRAERAEAEVERLKKQIKDDNRSYGCELRDPYGTIWEQATKDHDRAGKAERALAELREWQAGVIANERLHHAERKEALARAEKAESELAGIRALADRRNKSDHSQDTTHQLVAALDQALDIAQAELATERARVDQLILTHPLYDSRDQLDAAMKEGA